LAAKASVADQTEKLLAQGSAGLPYAERSDLSRASEQLKHFKGWVYASVRPIAQKIAGQPVHVGKEAKPKTTKAQATLKPFDSHPLLDLFRDPNDLMVSWSLMFVTVASLELTGRQLWWLPGKKAIYPIPTSWLKGFEGASKITAFRVQPSGCAEAFPLPADECCYFSYPDPSDPHGAVSPLQAVGGAVDSDESIETSRIAMFRRGIHPSHCVIVGKDESGFRPRLTGAQQRQIVGAILKRYGGVSRSGEPLILDGLIEDVKRLSLTPDEMDYLSSEKSTKARIMQGFGTNPIVCGEVEGANRASSLAASDHFAEFCVNPKIELLSQTLTEWLSPMFGGGIKVWIEPVVVHDAEMTLKWVTLLAQSGAIQPNEMRRLAPFELPEEPELKGHIVTAGFNPANRLASALNDVVHESVAELGADRILGSIDGGNGRL
jgi:HK97 family phage portal protein